MRAFSFWHFASLNSSSSSAAAAADELIKTASFGRRNQVCLICSACQTSAVPAPASLALFLALSLELSSHLSQFLCGTCQLVRARVALWVVFLGRKLKLCATFWHFHNFAYETWLLSWRGRSRCASSCHVFRILFYSSFCHSERCCDFSLRH